MVLGGETDTTYPSFWDFTSQATVPPSGAIGQGMIQEASMGGANRPRDQPWRKRPRTAGWFLLSPCNALGTICLESWLLSHCLINIINMALASQEH